jgi:PAS domain S-box-containing protein
MAEPQPELSEAERRYRILRSSVSDYHYHVRVARGQILEKCHEPTCAVITGYQPEEFAADPELSISIIEKDDRPLVERQTAELLKGREPPPVEYRLRRKDGQLRWIHKTVVPYRDAQGEVIAYDSLLSDVTESKLAEETLRLSEERYRLLFEDDLTGDYLAAPDGTILLCNHAFVEIFGFENRESALRSNLTDLYLDPLSWPRFI